MRETTLQRYLLIHLFPFKSKDMQPHFQVFTSLWLKLKTASITPLFGCVFFHRHRGKRAGRSQLNIKGFCMKPGLLCSRPGGNAISWLWFSTVRTKELTVLFFANSGSDLQRERSHHVGLWSPTVFRPRVGLMADNNFYGWSVQGWSWHFLSFSKLFYFIK